MQTIERHMTRSWNALTLEERLEILRASGANRFATTKKHSRQELERWRRQEPADEWSFERRMEGKGLSRSLLFRALDRRPPHDDELATAWAQPLIATLTNRPKQDDERRQPVSHTPFDFLALVEPFVQGARERVKERVAALLAGKSYWFGDAESLEYAFADNLGPHLLSLIGRTLVLELHAARLMEELPGCCPRERFASFIERLRDPDFAMRIFDEYPVLARLVTRAVSQWEEYCDEFVAHLKADEKLIIGQLLPGGSAGRVVQIQSGVGDRHQDGRSVLLVRFASGRQVVYKPKSMAVEVHFAQLLDWFNSRGAQPAFRPLRAIDCGDHGWAEFVTADPCDSEAEVADFYRRQGGYLAVLYLLGATDLHCENLIAAGPHPMFIDLEALFHQRLPGPRKDPASQGLSESVMAVRLLPQQVYVEGVPTAIDFSGIGATDGQPTPYLAPVWREVGTDQMYLDFERGVMPPSRHRPTLAGKDVELADYEPYILEGFSDTYDLLSRHRKELLQEHGPLAAFSADPVRFIARPSQTYAILLDQSLHPERLQDALERDRLFDRLWLRVREFPVLARLVEAEIADLQRHDLPLFRSTPASCDIWTAGGKRIEGFFDRPALDIVKSRLQHFSAKDKARQIWLIRTALSIMPSRLTAGDSARVDELARPVPSDSLERLPRAREIGDRLLELSYDDGEEVGWISLIRQERGWSIGPIDASVEFGLAGNAWFLAVLGATARTTKYTICARRTVETIQRRLSAGSELPGVKLQRVAVVLQRLAALWSDSALRDYSTEIANCIDGSSRLDGESIESLRPAYPQGVDIPSGLAGLAGKGLHLLGVATQTPCS